MNFKIAESIPSANLKDVTARPESETQKQFNAQRPSETDFLNGGKHTETGQFTPHTDNPSQPGLPMPGKPSGTALGGVLSGKFATDLMDVLVPALAVWIVARIGYAMNRKDLQLTAREKEVMTPAMQNFLDSINVNFNNPFYNLLFVVVGIYAAKVIEILPDMKKKEIVKKETESKKKEEETDLMTISEAIENGFSEKKFTKDEIISFIKKTKKYSNTKCEQYFNQNLDKYLPILKNAA